MIATLIFKIKTISLIFLLNKYSDHDSNINIQNQNNLINIFIKISIVTMIATLIFKIKTISLIFLLNKYSDHDSNINIQNQNNLINIFIK